jgi:hypothetical protein
VASNSSTTDVVAAVLALNPRPRDGITPDLLSRHHPHHFYPRRPRKRPPKPRKRLRGPQKQLPEHRLDLPRHHREVPSGRKIVSRHHPQAPRHHFDVGRGRFAHQREQREAILDDLKARRDRRRMMPGRLALTASRAKNTPHRLNPIDGTYARLAAASRREPHRRFRRASTSRSETGNAK